MRRVDCSTRLGRQEERRVFPYIARAPTHRSVARTKGIGIAILSRPAVPPSRRPAVLLWRCYGPIVDTTQHPASGHSSRTTAVPSSRLVEPFRVYVIETSSRVSEPLMSSH